MTDVKRIESYGLYDFCQDIEAAFKEGYVFDFDTNENFPTAYGTMLTCGLVKAGKKVETAANTEVVAEVETKVETEEVTEVEEVVTEEAETPETETKEVPETAPAKRGPKPKNK